MRRIILWSATALISAVLSLAGAELVVRLAGEGPWEFDHPHPDEPIIHEPDPALGWRTRPGRHVFPPYRLPGDPFPVTILPDGRRVTASDDERRGRPQLLAIGDSYTLGWGVADSETWPWMLQEARPDLHVRNYGVAGYGTYQTLLSLEQSLPRRAAPRFAVYGMLGHHESRNVPTRSWLLMLDRLARDGPGAVPYVTLAREGGLVRHAPVAYPNPPLRDFLALVNYAAHVHAGRQERRRGAKIPVTEALLRELQRVTRAHGAIFAVALLEFDHDQKKEATRAFLESEDIAVFDCAFRRGRGFRVGGEGHPNRRAHRVYADCIAAGLRGIEGAAGSSAAQR
jgi:hypothetical protein